MTTGTIGRDEQAALLERLPVNRIHIEFVRIRDRNLVLLSQGRIAVAGAAGIRQLKGINFRLRIRWGEDVMFTMAIAAPCRVAITVPSGAAMDAIGISLSYLRVALSALHQFEIGRV